MTKVVRALMTVFLIMTLGSCFSQTTVIKVGDTLPDMNLGEVVHYRKGNIRLSDFKGKLVILDFWATWCAPCISFFSTADSVQKQFKERVEIIPVTMEGKEKVLKLLADVKKYRNISPPSIIKDTILSRLFPYNTLPHEVWIDENRVVRAITSSENVTATNIASVLDDKVADIPVKIDEKLIDLDFKRPILTGAQGLVIDTGNVLFTSRIKNQYVSLLTNYNNTVPGWTSNMSNWVGGLNLSVTDLYKLAFGEGKMEFLANNRVILDLNKRDSSLVGIMGASDYEWNEWKQTHTFCYELNMFNSGKPGNKYEFMQQDLNRYFGQTFGIKAKREIRTTLSWVLVATDSLGTGFLSNTVSNALFIHERYQFKLKNQPLRLLISYLQAYYLQNSKMPILSEVDASQHVDLDLSCDLANITELNKGLKKYKLEFVQKTMPVDMILIYNDR